MAFNNFWRTFFAIGLTAFIFSLLVTTLCLIRNRERRQSRQAEARAQVVLPPPAAEEIEMPQMGNNNEFRHSDETLVEPPVSTGNVREESDDANHAIASISTFLVSDTSSLGQPCSPAKPVSRLIHNNNNNNNKNCANSAGESTFCGRG
jgi:hypothetical protein